VSYLYYRIEIEKLLALSMGRQAALSMSNEARGAGNEQLAVSNEQ
jgi:hypothetical protein